MGCIIRNAGIKEFTESGNIPKNIKVARKLAKLGKLKLMKRETFGVIIYSEVDFTACFEKHVQGNPTDDKDYHVLKRADGAKISEGEFRTVYKYAVQQGSVLNVG